MYALSILLFLFVEPRINLKLNTILKLLQHLFNLDNYEIIRIVLAVLATAFKLPKKKRIIQATYRQNLFFLFVNIKNYTKIFE